MNPASRRWILATFKLLIVAVVLWLVRGTLVQSWNQLREHPRPLHCWWLALSGGLYLLALLPEGIFWRLALRSLGQDVGLLETLRAYYIGHLGKYVPGKAMVIVLRTGLIRSHRVNVGIAVASVFLETLTMMAVGASIAVPVLAAWYPAIPHSSLRPSARPSSPGCRPCRRSSRGWRGCWGGVRGSPAIARKLAGFDYRTLLGGWAIMTCGWIAMGATSGRCSADWASTPPGSAAPVHGDRGDGRGDRVRLADSRRPFRPRGRIHRLARSPGGRGRGGPDRGGGHGLHLADGGSGDFDYPVWGGPDADGGFVPMRIAERIAFAAACPRIKNAKHTREETI